MAFPARGAGGLARLVALVMGLGFNARISGLAGILEVFAHRRWVLRVLLRAPVAPLGAANG
ncbi:hypothetical protein [Streptomyces sp. NPDC049970]|uniref:hypothetical protein n=1 Tax=Streptomyces sp. NPDC049970 TaxID=3155033 RepID=UPI0034234226